MKLCSQVRDCKSAWSSGWHSNGHKAWWSEGRSVVSDSLQPRGLYSPWNSPGQSTGVGSLSLLQGIFPTQRLNPGFPHCRQILYHLSHQGSPKILEWAAYSFSSRSSWSRNHTGVSCIAGGFFTSWASREALVMATRHEWWECSGSWSWWQLPWCKLCWNSLKYAF